MLCDGCDKGTHTYCCRVSLTYVLQLVILALSLSLNGQPKLTTIPKGDWYCRFCSSTVSGAQTHPPTPSHPPQKTRHRVCTVCDRGRGDLLHCSRCPKAYHKRCLTPPLSRSLLITSDLGAMSFVILSHRLPSATWICVACRRKAARKQAPPTSVPTPSTNHTSARKRK